MFTKPTRFMRRGCARIQRAVSQAIEVLEERRLLSAPGVTSNEFYYDTVPHELRFSFDQDVSATVGPEDNLLTNLTTGQQTDSTHLTRTSYNSGTNSAAFQVDSGIFEDGNYEDVLLAPGVKNGSNEPLASESSLPFYWLSGDVNRDRLVTGDDYTTIDSNLNAFPNGDAHFGDGDGNYDGLVTGDDYTSIDSNYGTRMPEPPTEPNSLIATSAIGPGRIDLQWTPPLSGERDGFRIFRSVDGGVNYTLWDQIPKPDATTWHDDGLPEGAKYSYRVRAFSWENGNSHTTNEAWAVTNLPGPGVAKPSSIATDSFTLNWSDNSLDEAGYQIWRSTDGDNFSLDQSLSAQSGYGDAMSASVSGLSGTQYFRVRATTSAQVSVWSPTLVVENPTAGVTPAPTNVQVTNLSSTSLTVTWDAPYLAQSSFLVYQKAVGGSRQLVGSVDGPARQLDVSDLTAGTAYEFEVEALDGQAGGGANTSGPATSGPVATQQEQSAPSVNVYGGTPIPGVTATWSPPEDPQEEPFDSGDAVTLTLSNLPHHTHATVSVQVYAWGSPQDGMLDQSFSVSVGDERSKALPGNLSGGEGTFYGGSNNFKHDSSTMEITVRADGLLPDWHWSRPSIQAYTIIPFVSIGGIGGSEAKDEDGRTFPVSFRVKREGTVLDEALKIQLDNVSPPDPVGAVETLDYGAAPRTVSIEAEQEFSDTIILPVNDDALIENNPEWVRLKIVPSKDYVVRDDLAIAEMGIADNDILDRPPIPPNLTSGPRPRGGGTGPVEGDPPDGGGGGGGGPPAPGTPIERIDLHIGGNDGNLEHGPSDPPTSGGNGPGEGDGIYQNIYVAVNDNFDEKSSDSDGPLADNDPTVSKITLSDPQLQRLGLTMTSSEDHVAGTWRLSWTGDQKIKVWLPDDARHPEKDWHTISSGYSGDGSDFGYGWGGRYGSSFMLMAIVEAIAPSDAKNDIVFTSEFTRAGGTTVKDVVKLTAVQVDLNIDSDNNNNYDSPQESQHEDNVEQVEGDPRYPGKIVPVNNDDGDHDGIIDYRDGYNFSGDPADDVQAKERFVPLGIKLPGAIDPTKATLKLDYAADTNPNLIGVAGSLRLWRKSGSSSRDGRSIGAGGDFVKPDTSYTIADLEGSGSQANLWLEALEGGAYPIKITVDPDGEGPLTAFCVDEVRVKALSTKFWITYSDQFIDGVANYLPGNSGEQDKYILMATRVDGNAHARADLGMSFKQEELPWRTQFSFQYLSSWNFSRSFSAFNDVVRAFQQPPADAGPTPMKLCWGVDFNRDGIFQPDELLGWDTHEFKVVSEPDLVASKARLNQVRTTWSGLTYKHAANLMYAFLNNVAPAGATSVADVLTTREPSFTHHVGGVFKDQSAPIRRAIFAPNSTLSQDVSSSVAMTTVIFRLRQLYEPTIRADFAANSNMVAKTYNLDPADQPIAFSMNETDLFFAIGGNHIYEIHLTLAATRDANGWITVVPVLRGKIRDLYDFNFEAGLFADDAAQVQAAHGSLHAGGHVFINEIQLDAEHSPWVIQ